MHFQKDIQGLRAVAVLSVVVFHAAARLLPGGFVGVDIFFVISGFLITKTIANDLNSGSFSFSTFYRKRIRRLCPALVAVVSATAMLSVAILPPHELALLGRSMFALGFNISNIELYRQTSYFGTGADLKPLLHTWSLAVEEQFYLLFPVLLVTTHKRGKSFTALTFFLIAGCSLAASIWTSMHHQSAAFFLAPSRAVELFIGALVALGVIPNVNSPTIREWLASMGAMAIAASLVFYSDATPFPYFSAMLPCLGTACVLLAISTVPTTLSRVLRVAPLVFVGDISYSLYLWHWPILALARHLTIGHMTRALSVVCVGAAVGVATLSWRYLEQPLLRLPLTRVKWFQLSAVTSACLAAAGFCLAFSAGLPGRFSRHAQAAFRASLDYSPMRRSCHSDQNVQVDYSRSCTFGDLSVEPTTAVWGDSFGVEIAAAIGEHLSLQQSSIKELTASGCPPALGFAPRGAAWCETYNARILQGVMGDAHLRSVYIVANYLHYDRELRNALERGLHQAVASLTKADKLVIVIEQVPPMPYDGPEGVGLFLQRSRPASSFGIGLEEYRSKSRWINEYLDELGRETNVEVIRPQNALCGGRFCSGYDAHTESVLYFDDVHLSLAGARLLVAETMTKQATLLERHTRVPSTASN